MVMNVSAVPTVLGEEQSMCRVFCDSPRSTDLLTENRAAATKEIVAASAVSFWISNDRHSI